MGIIEEKTIKSGTILYRYDIVRPPFSDWTDEYKSLIYDNYQNDVGPKNAIGAFFFFDDRTTAIEVARNVLKQKEWIKEVNPNLNIWLTTTIIQDDICMLDLSGCQNIVELYVSLWNNGIDIFREDFYKFGDWLGSKPLSLLLEDIKYLAFANGKKEKNKVSTCKCNIENFYNTYEDKEKLPYACQELTDFSNGKIFKELLEEKGIEGYIFQETDAKTFCIFNSKRLSNPVTIKF